MAQAEKFLELPLEDVISDRFGRYSKYIIQDRALPDARDGLKPVQRRILFAMHQDGNTSDKPYRKSAKTVGNVIGNYHPHGDSSVYEAMVRLSQTWKMRYPLIEMHGNNGSIDGDPPAAMRYTEARLSPIASQLLRDIEKQTVEFTPNFDDTLNEPVVLPAMFPNLLVNGSTGISAGYATEIPPHHLGEVIDACIMQLKNPDCTLDELMTVIKGPDFPTGGIVQGIDGIKQAYETGRGRIVVRGAAAIEKLRGGRSQITITELPPDVNKANLVKKIDELRIDRKIEGISEIRDETDRTGLRIVIELKKDADANGILNYLYKNTELQITYSFNMVAIYNKTPRQMGLKQLLNAYIEHQKEIVTNRSNYELKKAKERLHIVEGLIKAISILDDVIKTIRQSKNKQDAKKRLSEQFQFTEQQSEAIVTLQLYRLTNTDVTTLEKEAVDLEKQIAKLEEILNDEKKLIQVIIRELTQVKKQFADERRTKIEEEIEEIKINLEVTVPQEDVIVTVTRDGYVKRTSLRSYGASNPEDIGMKESDRLLAKLEMSTTDTLLLFTNKGNYLYVPVHMLPDIRWKDLGQHIANLAALDKNETLIQAIPVENFDSNQFLVFLTKNGLIKKSELTLYQAQRTSKPLTALKLKENDEVVHVALTNDEDEVIIVTKNGYALRYQVSEVNPVGLRTMGVKAIDFKEENDEIADVAMISEQTANEQLVILTQRGAMKKLPIEQLKQSKRGRRGTLIIKEIKTNPHQVIACKKINETNHIHVQTENTVLTFAYEQIRDGNVSDNGPIAIQTKKHGSIIDVWVE